MQGMKFHSVDEYLKYTGLADLHPELVHLINAERLEHAEFVDDLYDQLNSYMEEPV